MTYNVDSIVAKVFKMCVDGEMVKEVAQELLRKVK